MTDNAKSVSITNLDTFGTGGGPVTNSTGLGAPAVPRKMIDSAAFTAGGIAATGSKYRILRVPTGIYLQHVSLFFDGIPDTGGGSAALTVNVGFWYSDSTVDGTPAANQGTVVSATAVASAASILGGVQFIDVESFLSTGGWVAAKRAEPLWAALGLSTDPGGFFDLSVAVQTGANTGAAGILSAEIEYYDA